MQHNHSLNLKIENMKNLFGIVAFVILTSFAVANKTRKLSNWHYKVEMDKEYKDAGVNDYDFTLENEKFITPIADKYETLEIIWVDDNTFKVLGLTEPANPTELEKWAMMGSKMYFRIYKQEKNTYFFKLGEENDNYPVYAGKFVKTE